MRKIIALTLSTLLLLSACAPKFEKQQEIVNESEDTTEQAIIPKYQISDQFYRTVLTEDNQIKPSESRGLVVSGLNTRYDIDEVERGLMRIAQDTFSPDEYFFQEGQYLDRQTVQSWLSRKLTPEQLQEKLNEDPNYVDLGLNPSIDTTANATLTDLNQESPIYLAHILEHNYLVEKDEQTVELGGIVIGLALNSVHYYKQEQGYDREVNIDRSVLEKEGKKIAEEVVRRVKLIDGLGNIPIVVALFEQQSKSSIVPGNFFTQGNVKADSSSIDKWSDINEKYYLFPSDDAENEHREDVVTFNRLKDSIAQFFPNYTGIIGKGFYKDDTLQQMTIEIPMQFYGKSEVIGFTQYVTNEAMEIFPNYISLQMYISSVRGQESIVIREAGEEEPFVHIFQ
ncbi:CamS family sex pheromone protein [Cytobacillus sp. IB215665]|uniref:CamS family sex pheromone protein n=1 Tax=Cytobacillus sp. IB215665 TaxID=3097357 RepID=UPI002A183929|nr:CamS family sex pheromone protein [Cytobacillus sp. IB215665]MDX8365187.1 CamS family sex pheromone protein [Cytobacillus sp. IB215665]